MILDDEIRFEWNEGDEARALGSFILIDYKELNTYLLCTCKFPSFDFYTSICRICKRKDSKA